MIRVYLSLLGLSHYTELGGVQNKAPAEGDWMTIITKEFKKPSRLLMERTRVYHCFERNNEAENASLGDFLADNEFTVSGKKNGAMREIFPIVI